MKRKLFRGLLTSSLALSLQTLLAAGPSADLTADNFNSRPGVKLSEVKGYLQWQLLVLLRFRRQPQRMVSQS
ncbi:hypothetical protein ACQ86N_41355 [Puia sp. P3]|uniref:hypothetical protein n=1 Tax=Puia sp. P3 TaxID=3423952 RepID=UPI003D677C39